jgi:sugar phosphate isomerase/epimerase
MVDEEGFLGHPDPKERTRSISNHQSWLHVAAVLGCHSIRVNAHSIGKKEEQQRLAADGLARLCDLSKPLNLDVIIENHGGMSSQPEWLVETIKATGKENIGTMVDFDNFNYSEDQKWNGDQRYDRYEGVKLLLPYARSVSAKSHAFNDQGLETTIDYKQMVQLVHQSNFKLYTSVEYEGNELSERDGIRATKALLERFEY